MTADALPLTMPRPASRAWVRILLGVLLILPAMLACLLTLVAPCFYTTYLSLTDTKIFSGSSQLVGFDNYTTLFSDEVFTNALLPTLLIVGVRVVLMAVIPPLIGAGFGRRGKWLQAGVGVIAAGSLAAATPFLAAASLRLLLHEIDLRIEPRVLLLSADGIITLVTACVIGLTFTVAAYRQEGDRPRRKTLWWLWGISLLVAAASALATFSLSYGLLLPSMRDRTFLHLLFQFTVNYNNLGVGSVVGVVLSTVLSLLGVLAVVLVIASKLKIQMTEPITGDSPRKSTLSVIFLVVGLLLLVVSCLGMIAVYTSGAMAGFDLDAFSLDGLPLAFVRTLLPPFVVVFLLQMPLTYLGALGIGGLRPLGKKSELLLLLFAPGLFLAPALWIPAYVDLSIRFDIYHTWLFAAPPVLFSVLAMVILTLFFKGQENRWKASDTGTKGFFRQVILPSIPLASLLAFANVWMMIGDHAYLLAVGSTPDATPLQVVINMLLLSLSEMAAPVILLGGLLIGGLFFVVFSLFHSLYINRLTLTVDTE